MSAAGTGLGYNRFVRRAWFDRALEEAASGADPEAARAALDAALAPEVAGDVSRKETVRVLYRVWLAPTPALSRLRAEAITLYRAGADPLALHWGMSLAAYPFFRVVAEAVGRPLRLDGQATAPAVLRRVADTHGDRPTVRRAAQRVLQSSVEWGALVRDSDGPYRAAAPVSLDPDTSAWLLAALLASLRTPSAALDSLAASPALFPFVLERVHRLAGGNELMRQGGRDVAVLAASAA